jgi:hypothetical protein
MLKNLQTIKYFYKTRNFNFSILEEMKRKARREFKHYETPQKDLTILFDAYKMEAHFNGKRDYNKIFDKIMDIKTFYKTNKPDIPGILHEIQYDIEQNVHKFNIDQLIKLATELTELNYISIPFMDHLQRNIGDRIYFEKNLEKVSNDKDFMNNLLNYFKNTTDISMMRLRNLDYILNYFVQRNNYIFDNESTTYDFIWLTSLALATHYHMNNFQINLYRYTDKDKNPLSERGARDLLYLLNKASSLLNKNYSENSVPKVRLYKALYYLKLEGLELNDRLEGFLKDFRPYYLLNMENRLTNSNLEKSFEQLLVERNINFTKEKKLDFCMVDYFVEPNFVFEVNGPMHYFDILPRAKDLLKKRVLEHMNYNVIFVHYNFKTDPYFQKQIEEGFNNVAEVQKINEEIKKEVNVETIRQGVKKVKKDNGFILPKLVIPEINH